MTISSAWRPIRMMLVCGDAVAAAGGYVLADYARTRWWLGTQWPEVLAGYDSPFAVHYWVLLVLPWLWPLLLSRSGWYEPRSRRARWYVGAALAAGIIQALVLAALALFLRREAFPRMQIVLASAVVPATTLVTRSITGLAGRWLAERSRRHVLIVGCGRDAVRLRRILRASPLGRSSVVGHLTLPDEDDRHSRTTGAILGDVSRLATLLDEQVIDEVFFAARVEQMPAVLPYVRLCEEVGVTAHVLAESMVCHSPPRLEDLHGVPLLAYAPVRHAPELLAIKRAVDLFLAAVGIIVTGPIMLLCAALIRASSPGSILFRQERTGLNGRRFRMLKFRTMRPDAESLRKQVAHLNEFDGPVFKSRSDPRVTAVGAALRRYSLDELPQLFNVLRGDMSIVGPRPPLPEEVARYDRWQRRRLSMRPGLTCLWQIRGRRPVPFDDWMRLDLFYIDHWSLRLDFAIMLRTVPTVLSGTGT